MADRLEDLLRGCTVRVLGGPMPGAGFFVAPRRVLTCMHVIGDDAALMVRWERDGEQLIEVPVLRRVAELDDRGRPIPALARDYPDIAVLEVGGLGDHPCVAIDLEWPSQQDTFQVFGYPEEGGAVQLTPARLTYRGTHGTLPTAYLELASDTIKPGMSGAAVLNLRSGAVCGVVVASKHPARPDGALAVPWSAVQGDLAELLAHNRAFQLRDRRWEEAATSRRERLRFRLPRVVAHFTGRNELLARLHAALGQRQAGVITQAISGLGGVGKTQLAAAYVAAHQDEYDIVAWIRAEDGGIADLAELAVALALPTAGRNPSERASDVLVYLSNCDRRWLLVFDNAPGPQALENLPSSGNGRVLVTSRWRGGYDTFGAEVTVDVFEPATARRYLLARSGRSDQEAGDAQALAIVLGCLPLALTHAGAYCAAETGVPLRDYLELLEGLPAGELFDSNPEVFYQHTIAATWNTSIAAASQQAPLAGPALRMGAYLAPEGSPRSFFSVLGENSAAGRKRVADALAALHRYSLATVTGNQIGVHRLLQKVIRDRLVGLEQASAAANAHNAVQMAMPDDARLPAAWPQWQELVPHVAALARIEAVAALSPATLTEMLNRTVVFLLSAGPPGPALDLAAQAVSISAEHLGSEHLATLEAQANLASAYREAGRAIEAIAIEQQVAAVRERILGPEAPGTLAARINLASSYLDAGRTGEAIALDEQLVTETARVLGPGHAHSLTVRSSLALAYRDAKRNGEAIAILEPLIADCEHALGPDHPHTLTALSNLAALYEETGRIGEAVAIRERLVIDRERVLGPDHPDTILGRGNLAYSYMSAGRTAEAINLLEKVMADRARVLGPGNPETLAGRGTLAAWYREAGRNDEAISILEQVVADSRRFLGPEHPQTLTAQGNLATSYRLAGRTAEAITIMEQVAASRASIFGPDHPETLEARAVLAGWYSGADRTGEAIALEEQVAASRARVLGSEHPDTLRALGNLAVQYSSAGRIPEAIALEEQVAAARERVLGTEHPDTLTARANLALSYHSAGRTAEAVALLERVVADRVRLLGSEHPDTLSARAFLALWYYEVRRIGDAIAYQEPLVADYERLRGHDHRNTLVAWANLANSYKAAGRTEEAIVIQEPLVTDFERLFGPEHSLTVTARANLAAYRETSPGS